VKAQAVARSRTEEEEEEEEEEEQEGEEEEEEGEAHTQVEEVSSTCSRELPCLGQDLGRGDGVLEHGVEHGEQGGHRAEVAAHVLPRYAAHHGP
jgi:hypothetical protein